MQRIIREKKKCDNNRDENKNKRGKKKKIKKFIGEKFRLRQTLLQ